jgi:hypothetical protein
MTPHATAELPAPPASDRCACSISDGLAPAGIVGALLEALNAPGSYRLVHAGGELFLEPVRET